MDATKILSRVEIAAVLKDMKRRAKRSKNSLLNLVIFRLSCCCGLRVKEIVGLNMNDVVVEGERPAIRVRKAITKGKPEKRKGRIVPLWWDKGTLEDLKRWVEFRKVGGDEPFICSVDGEFAGQRLSRPSTAKRWRTALRILGEQRRKQVSIHCGRHSFCTHSAAVGRSLIEIRDAAGHSDVKTTNVYLHYIEREFVPDLFDFVEQNGKSRKQDRRDPR